jgi:hypothetical protein
MSKTKWHKGAPPSIGWWPASCGRQTKVIRWWNGAHWSDFVEPSYSAEFAAKYATIKAVNADSIEWTERWWL